MQIERKSEVSSISKENEQPGKEAERVVNETEGTACKYCALKVKKQNYFKEENVFTSLIAAERLRRRRRRTEN